MSFRLKTIIGIAVIEIVLLAILITSSLHFLRSSNQEELQRRAEVTAQLLATMTSDAVLASDLATLDTLVAQTLKNDGLVYVRIRNTSGIVLAQGGDSDALKAAFISDAGADKITDQRYDLSAPIAVGGAQFGQVEIGLSNSLLDHIVAAGTQRMLTIAALEIALVAVFGFFLGSILTRQLAGLRASAKRVAAGEFGHQMKVVGKDELADTATSFNKMSKALADYSDELKAERDKAEAGRAYAENVLDDAMNSTSQAIFVVDADHKVEFINKAARKIHQLDWKKLGQTPAFDKLLDEMLLHVDSDRAPEKLKEERLALLAQKDGTQTWQCKLQDGTILLHTQRPMANGGIVQVDTDITELYATMEKNKRLEMELLQAHKLESLGTLASGVAHEINTPAQFIGDNLRFVTESFTPMHQLIEKIKTGEKLDVDAEMEELDWDFLAEEIPTALHDATNGIETIGKIVRSIKEFSHPDAGERQHADVAKLIETTATVSRPQWRHRAELNIVNQTDDASLSCFPGDLSQVMINLIVNAADALEERKQDDPEHQGVIDVTLERDTDAFTIKVQDNAGGIPVDVQHSVFDMFFTTKPPGKGTGQGLAISKKLIETKHGGQLLLETEIGKGTCFTIKLPIEDQNDTEEPQALQADKLAS